MNPTLPSLKTHLNQTVHDLATGFISRYMPDFSVPPTLAGFPTNPADAIPVIKVLSWLSLHGHQTVSGVDTREAIGRLLKQIDGPATETFNAFLLSEILLSHGPFKNNPLLQGFSPAEMANIASGCDSSHIRLQNGKALGGRPNNYWGVLARCELGRLNLGLISDTTLFDECLGQVKQIAFQNPLGFFDDHRELEGRYDIYSADVLLFLEPLWPHLRKDPDSGAKLDMMLHNIVSLVENMALKGGVSWAWGRTIAGHSHSMLAEIMALALAHGYASDRPRALFLLNEAVVALQGLFKDDYTSVQRTRGIERYRMAWRLFENTFDLIGKFCFVADQLEVCPENDPSLKKPLSNPYPERDVFVPFDGKNAGVWVFRNAHMAFQLPVVAFNDSAGYLPFPHAPGLFENPCDNFSLVGSPRVLFQGRQYTTGGRPTRVEKQPAGITLFYSEWQAADLVPYAGPYTAFLPPSKRTENTFPGTRVVTFQVEGNQMIVNEDWVFVENPNAVQLDFAQCETPFSVAIKGDITFRQSFMPVEGIFDWRTPFGSVKILHQFSFVPNKGLSFTYSLFLSKTES